MSCRYIDGLRVEAIGFGSRSGTATDTASLLPMNRFLLALGIACIIASLLWPWLKRIPLFHLPGDILIDRPGFKFFFHQRSVHSTHCRPQVDGRCR